MKESKRTKLEAAGWRVGSADEFLGLSAAESELVELRLSLSYALRARREKLRLSQRALADRIASSQSRVAKMEAADPEVTIDLLLRGLLATGATRRDLAKAIDAKAGKTSGRPSTRSTASRSAQIKPATSLARPARSRAR